MTGRELWLWLYLRHKANPEKYPHPNADTRRDA
jgi:hypothetical protein